MKHKIAAGVLLIEKGTLVPDSMPVRSEPYSEGWESVRNLNSRELNRGLHGAGWTFSFLADEVHKSSLGFDKQRGQARGGKAAANEHEIAMPQLPGCPSGKDAEFPGIALRERLRAAA